MLAWTRWITMFLLLISLITLGVLNSKSKPIPEKSPTTQQSDPTDVALPHTSTPQFSPKAADKREAAERIAIKQYLLAEHPAEIERRIDSSDPIISRYRLLAQRKVLLNAEEKHELEDLLKDAQSWQIQWEYLEQHDFSHRTLSEEQLYRLFILQYLASSIEFAPSPEKFAQIVQLILLDNFSPELSLDAKRILAYEKIKLLEILQQQSPTTLATLRNKLPTVRHRQLLETSLQEIESRSQYRL